MNRPVGLEGATGVCRRPEDISPAWLTRRLVAAGRLADGARVERVEVTPIGTGQMADTVRLDLVFDPSGSGPASLIAKVASADEQSHATGRQMRAYEVEVNFYATVAARTAARTPGVVACAFDPVEAWFTLVLDDVVAGEQGDQIAGCDVDVAARCVAELAGLHAPVTEAADLAAMSWLNRSTPAANEFTAAVVASVFPGFLERYADAIEPELVALLEAFIPRLDAWFATRSGPSTVTHGDFRLDNLLFVPGEERPVVVDFQTASWGSGAADLAYFIGGSLAAADRLSSEADLVAEYIAQLASLGDVHVDRDQFEASYRLGTLGGVVMGIGASMLVQRTPRGDEMFVTSTRRHARHALDLDALALIGGGP